MLISICHAVDQKVASNEPLDDHFENLEQQAPAIHGKEKSWKEKLNKVRLKISKEHLVPSKYK